MIVPKIERENWRWYLFELFCHRRRIDNLIEANLRPLWRAAVSEDDTARRVQEFTALGSPRRLAMIDPTLLLYVEAVQKAVTETLRLRRDGKPAKWGCIHLHARVEGLAGGGFREDGKPAGIVAPDPYEAPPRPQPGEKPSARFRAMMAELRIVLNPAGASVEIVQPTGEPTQWVPAGDFMRFEEWDALRRTAHAAVDRQLDWMRQQFDEWYPTKRNPTTHERWKADAEELARYLVGRSPAPRHGPERDRLYKFARYVGTDFPVS